MNTDVALQSLKMRKRDRSGLLKTLIIVLVIFASAAAASYLTIDAAQIGSKTYLAVGLLLVSLPLLVHFAVQKPFIFPLGLFIMLAPIDPLLNLKSSSHAGTLTKFVAAAAGAAIIFWLVRHRRYINPGRAALLWVLFLVWAALSIFWAGDATNAVTKVTTYAELIALYLAIALVPITEDQYKSFVFVVALSGLMGAAGSVYLYKHGSFIAKGMTHGIVSSRLNVKIADSALNPDFFSVALLLPAAIVLLWALQQRWSLKKLVLIGGFLIMVGGIYVLGSRAAFLALFVMIAYMILRSRFRGQLLALSMGAFALSFLPPISVWSRFATALSTGGSGRISIWEVGLEAFRRHWLAGAGFGNFPNAYNQAFISVYQKFYASWGRAPHNILLEVAVELGVVGLVLFLAAFFAQIRALSIIPRTSRLYDMRIMLEGTLIALFVQGQFSNLLAHKVTWILFSLAAATRSFAIVTEQRKPTASEVPVHLQLIPAAQEDTRVPANA